MQCRHWGRHIAKASFIPPAWVTDTGLAEQVQTPSHARVLKNISKQVMSFAQRLKRMATPVKSAQQLGSQTARLEQHRKSSQTVCSLTEFTCTAPDMTRNSLVLHEASYPSRSIIGLNFNRLAVVKHYIGCKVAL